MRTLNIVVLCCVVTGPLFAELSIKNIEKMVEDIRTKRVSKLKDTTPTVSPFIVVNKDENVSVIVKMSDKAIKTDFVLGALINDSAFIDGKWRKQGDAVGDFQLDAIGDSHVVLKRKNRTITLYFRKTKDILKIGKE